jgi:ABC-type Fe3+ transport system substrate-binding protein
VFAHDSVAVAEAGFPIKTVIPCEGTGYEIGSMSIIKGARNLENAKKFYDFALTAEFQNMAQGCQVLPGAVEQGGQEPRPRRRTWPRSS